MLIFRNTQKVSKEIGLKKGDIVDTDNEGYLGSWFCNIVTVNHRKCLIFCHSTTLYCFWVPAVKKKDFSNIIELFLKNLALNLKSEGIAEVTIENLLNEYDSPLFSKTNNRSVLGSMNDYAYLFEAYVEPLGPAGCDILAVNKKINTAPMSALKYSSGINEMKRLLMRVSI
ncbi:DUF6933 domain-containing protein [Gilvimarinus polysaccharolyticus]|uniref:DUF6933 domain-containing protein n=1 Tax=Gilvimarinus polysaccharolyticus TaxID=863921 RepID=UPI00067395FA|nr:hypothetical protein [Gilvimarinus polysaccharolyticus]